MRSLDRFLVTVLKCKSESKQQNQSKTRTDEISLFYDAYQKIRRFIHSKFNISRLRFSFLHYRFNTVMAERTLIPLIFIHNYQTRAIEDKSKIGELTC